jgi:uncharacterized protein (TIGR03083 family)
MTDNFTVDDYIAAWAQSLTATIDIGDGLTAEQWALPTECPLWTVQDVYSHLVGGEAWTNNGRPPLPNPDAFTDAPVRARRELDGPTVLAELRQEFQRRRDSLVTRKPDLDDLANSPFGRQLPMRTLLRMRVFDVWTHEQDVRRAVGVAGDLDTAAAHVSARQVRPALPTIVGLRAGLRPGMLVRFTVTGPVAFEEWLTVQSDGPAVATTPGAAHPDVHITVGWEEYARLSAGRITPERAAPTVDGDQTAAASILASLTVTP